MTDITTLFRATIKSMKIKLKTPERPDQKSASAKLFPNKAKQTEFSKSAKDTKNAIAKLRIFLLENRKAYLSSSAHCMSSMGLHDSEKDKLDIEAEKYIRTCKDVVDAFKSKVLNKTNNSHSQMQQHHEFVIHLLEGYLKEVCRIYSEQRAIRVGRIVQRKRISQLEADTNKKMRFRDQVISAKSEQLLEKHAKNNKEWHPRSQQTFWTESDSEEISAPDEQMLAQENQQLFNDMASLMEDVKQVEMKVVEISKLQEIFADNILQQDADVQRISNAAIGTTENIKDANEDIREAMRNNAGLRFWILFIIVVMTCTLLFLDWYNP